MPISWPGRLDDVEGQRAGDADDGDGHDLRQPEQPEPDDLAGQQLPRLHRREQQLDHPGRLLLDDALRDELADQDEQRVEHDHADDRDAGPLAGRVAARVERRDADLRDVELRRCPACGELPAERRAGRPRPARPRCSEPSADALHQQLAARCPVPSISAPSTSPASTRAARRGLVGQPDDGDVGADGLALGLEGRLQRGAVADDADRDLVSPPEATTTWKTMPPRTSSRMTAELIRNVLSRMRVEISRPATSRTSARAARRPRARSRRHLRGAARRRPRGTARPASARRQAKWVTRPVRSAAASTAWSSVPAASSSRVSPACSETTRTPGSARGPAGGGVRDDDPQQPAGLAAAQLLDRAGGDHPAAGEDADRVAEPLDEVELVAGEDDRDTLRAAWSSSASARESTPTGSRPENGSSRMSTSGRLTSAAASWTRCWLPSDSFSTGSPRRSPRPSRLDPLVGGARGGRGVQAVQPGEVGDLLADLHLRVEAALLRHVADPAADLLVQRPALPADLAGVGADQAHGDPHRRRLAGAVGAAEAEHRAGRDGEADAVEHVVVAEALVQPVELEHRFSCRRWLPVPKPYRPPALARGTPRCGVIGGMSRERIRPSRPRAWGWTGCATAAAGCRACELWEPATQTVFGEGPETARIVFVGEQPGDQEDRKGEPFVGPAGQAARPGARRRRHRPPRRLRHQRREALPVHAEGQAADPPDARARAPARLPAVAGGGVRRAASPRSSSASARPRPRR